MTTTASTDRVVTGPFYDPRDRTGRGPKWVVVVKDGCRATHERFYEEAEGEKFAAAARAENLPLANASNPS